MNDTTDHGHASDHEDHGGLGKYIAVFVALCLLTGASFFTYSDYWPYHDQPAVGWTFMMAVSCTKAMLVVMFFMHLLWEANWKYVLTIPCIVMSVILVSALTPDVGLRYRHANRQREMYMAIPQAASAAAEHPAEHPADEPGHETPH